MPPPGWLPPEIAAAWDDWLRCRTVSEPAALASVAENAARTAADAARVYPSGGRRAPRRPGRRLA
ncbi:hypothetical protein ACRJ4W_39285 [Streptomyces sp. GLT-R25]